MINKYLFFIFILFSLFGCSQIQNENFTAATASRKIQTEFSLNNFLESNVDLDNKTNLVFNLMDDSSKVAQLLMPAVGRMGLTKLEIDELVKKRMIGGMLMLNGTKPLRFNKHQNRLYIDMDWTTDVQVGQFVIVDCYRALDPQTWADVWNDMWLKRYATALIKKQWATNIKKFSGLQLPGGVTLDGDKLYEEASDELKELEDQMQTNYSLPPDFMIG